MPEYVEKKHNEIGGLMVWIPSTYSGVSFLMGGMVELLSLIPKLVLPGLIVSPL